MHKKVTATVLTAIILVSSSSSIVVLADTLEQKLQIQNVGRNVGARLKNKLPHFAPGAPHGWVKGPVGKCLLKKSTYKEHIGRLRLLRLRTLGTGSGKTRDGTY